MEEISVVIPIMINYPNRKQNVECVVNYLLRYPYLHIDVLEAGRDRFLHLPAHPRLRYTYVPDDAPVFYHTYYRNRLLQQAKYPIVGVWDADAIVSEEQFLAAADYIRRGAVMCFPYDGDFRYLSKAESQAVRADLNQLRPDEARRHRSDSDRRFSQDFSRLQAQAPGSFRRDGPLPGPVPVNGVLSFPRVQPRSHHGDFASVLPPHHQIAGSGRRHRIADDHRLAGADFFRQRL